MSFTGGELAAMTMIDATVRLIPEVIGKEPVMMTVSRLASWSILSTPGPGFRDGRSSPRECHHEKHPQMASL